jgi:plastocyanin
MLGTRRFPLALALAASLALVASACAQEEPAATGGGGGGEEGSGTIEIAGQEAQDHGAEEVTGASEIEVELDDFYFEPTVLEGEAGQTLTVSLFNEGEAPHTFTVDELDVDEELQPGDEGISAEVTFPDSGALVYYCRFHVGGGMLGGLSAGGDLAAASDAPGGGSGTTEDDTNTGPGY